MNVTLVDNNDLLIEIWTTNPLILTTIINRNLFKKWHFLEDNLLLARCSFYNFDAVRFHLKDSEYKIVLTRFTTGTQYFSSDSNDMLLGHNIVG